MQHRPCEGAEYPRASCGVTTLGVLLWCNYPGVARAQTTGTPWGTVTLLLG